MKFSYKFSNLLGTIYRNGNLLFTPDGNSLISPVFNRINIYDLKNNKSRTLSLESRYNYTATALSPDGTILIAVNENGEAQLISMISCTIIHRHKFLTGVQSVKFSPNGVYFAVARENNVVIFKSPGELTGEYNPFVLERHFMGGYDDVTWLDWSSDSRFLAIGCRDNSTKVIGLHYMKPFRTFILGGHTDSIVACFFEENSLHLNTLSRNGQLCLWECSVRMQDIEEVDLKALPEAPPQRKRTKVARDSESEPEDDVEEELEAKQEDEGAKSAKGEDKNVVNDDDVRKRHPFFYRKLGRHYLANEPRKEHPDAQLTAAHYNRRTKIMVIGFSTGSFYLYELPDVNMIHSLSISDFSISTALFNATGDWVALASRELGQLLVWEWQSEQYIMKQQGHTSEMTSISYSPDGQFIATGGQDGKLKLWNTQNGFCFVTFTDHTSGITGVQFSRNKKFLVSCSLDGSVRAFDIIRYRNFRTFTSPEPAQFSCVAIDYSGELIAAGSQDVFDIFLWSVKLGKLLEVISGHESPVASLAFSPVPTESTMISGSWDGSIKIWNCLESNSEHETIDVTHDVTAVAFNPNGEQIAVATINAFISVFDVKTAMQVCTIEGQNDLASGRSVHDVVTAKTNQTAKFFTTIEYSANGECILAAGNSSTVCIYQVREGILLKKFEITMNHSFDGLDEYINRKHLSEFGNMALIEKRDALEGGNVAIPLPGVTKGDNAARKFMPEVKCFCVRFSPTGQAFAVACTEGLCVYSLDKGVVFDPFNLSVEVTPKAIREQLQQNDFTQALVMAIKLNDFDTISFVLEKIPYRDIELICSTLPNEIAHRLLQHIAKILQTSPHLEFYLQWSSSLLVSHGNKDGVFQHQSYLAMHESISRKYETLSKMCDFNKYTTRMLLEVHEARKKKAAKENPPNSDSDMSDSGQEDEDEDEMFLMKANDDLEVKEAEFESSSEEE